MKLDVSFQLFSRDGSIPADHAYPIYSALSRIVPELHEQEDIGIHPICGVQSGDRRQVLTKESRLVIRIEPERIAMILPLAGKTIGLGALMLQIGVPTINGLVPSPTLRSRLVTIKGAMEPESFCVMVRRRLDAMDVDQQVKIHLGKRRTLRIHEKEVVGFETFLTELTEEESIRVQEIGLGGRRKMGCGILTPFKKLPSEYDLFQPLSVAEGGG